MTIHITKKNFIVALHALIHSLHIIKMILKFKWSQQYTKFPNQTVGLKDIARSSLHGLHEFCLGGTSHARLI